MLDPGAVPWLIAARKNGSRFQWPSALRTRLRLASSTLMRLISRRPRQSEKSRIDAVDRVGVEHRLGAVGRIFFDGEIGENEARPRQEAAARPKRAAPDGQARRDISWVIRLL